MTMKRPLPNYYLADLPANAPMSPQIIRDACLNLKRNREKFLASRTTSMMVRLLSEVGDQWLQEDYPFRQRALEDGPDETGFSVATLREGLDGFFRQLTPENLQSLLAQDLGSIQRLDSFAQTSQELQERRASWAQGPELVAHIAAGNLPNPALSSLVLGLLTRSGQFMKCGRGAAFIPRLFAHSLYELDPKAASCLEIAQWTGGNHELEAALLGEINCLTATGSEETLEDLRKRIPAHVRFLGYGHRVSFGYVTSESISGYAAKKLIARAASDIVAWDQQGCLSPHMIYVEQRGGATPEGFAEQLAQELERRETLTPRGTLSIEESAAIASRRSFYEVRAAHNPDCKLWCSRNSTAWTVVYENDPLFQVSCLNRFIHVRAANDLDQVLRHAESVRGLVSTVGLGASAEQAPALAQRLARWGVTRVCPLGTMQNPPLTWRHDGRPALADLVQWTDWEQ